MNYEALNDEIFHTEGGSLSLMSETELAFVFGKLSLVPEISDPILGEIMTRWWLFEDPGDSFFKACFESHFSKHFREYARKLKAYKKTSISTANSNAVAWGMRRLIEKYRPVEFKDNESENTIASHFEKRVNRFVGCDGIIPFVFDDGSEEALPVPFQIEDSAGIAEVLDLRGNAVKNLIPDVRDVVRATRSRFQVRISCDPGDRSEKLTGKSAQYPIWIAHEIRTRKSPVRAVHPLYYLATGEVGENEIIDVDEIPAKYSLARRLGAKYFLTPPSSKLYEHSDGNPEVLLVASPNAKPEDGFRKLEKRLRWRVYRNGAWKRRRLIAAGAIIVVLAVSSVLYQSVASEKKRAAAEDRARRENDEAKALQAQAETAFLNQQEAALDFAYNQSPNDALWVSKIAYFDQKGNAPDNSERANEIATRFRFLIADAALETVQVFPFIHPSYEIETEQFSWEKVAIGLNETALQHYIFNMEELEAQLDSLDPNQKQDTAETLLGFARLMKLYGAGDKVLSPALTAFEVVKPLGNDERAIFLRFQIADFLAAHFSASSAPNEIRSRSTMLTAALQEAEKLETLKSKETFAVAVSWYHTELAEAYEKLGETSRATYHLEEAVRRLKGHTNSSSSESGMPLSDLVKMRIKLAVSYLDLDQPSEARLHVDKSIQQNDEFFTKQQSSYNFSEWAENIAKASLVLCRLDRAPEAAKLLQQVEDARANLEAAYRQKLGTNQESRLEEARVVAEMSTGNVTGACELLISLRPSRPLDEKSLTQSDLVFYRKHGATEVVIGHTGLRNFLNDADLGKTRDWILQLYQEMYDDIEESTSPTTRLVFLMERLALTSEDIPITRWGRASTWSESGYKKMYPLVRDAIRLKHSLEGSATPRDTDEFETRFQTLSLWLTPDFIADPILSVVVTENPEATEERFNRKVSGLKQVSVNSEGQASEQEEVQKLLFQFHSTLVDGHTLLWQREGSVDFLRVLRKSLGRLAGLIEEDSKAAAAVVKELEIPVTALKVTSDWGYSDYPDDWKFADYSSWGDYDYSSGVDWGHDKSGYDNGGYDYGDGYSYKTYGYGGDYYDYGYATRDYGNFATYTYEDYSYYSGPYQSFGRWIRGERRRSGLIWNAENVTLFPGWTYRFDENHYSRDGQEMKLFPRRKFDDEVLNQIEEFRTSVEERVLGRTGGEETRE